MTDKTGRITKTNCKNASGCLPTGRSSDYNKDVKGILAVKLMTGGRIMMKKLFALLLTLALLGCTAFAETLDDYVGAWILIV